MMKAEHVICWMFAMAMPLGFALSAISLLIKHLFTPLLSAELFSACVLTVLVGLPIAIFCGRVLYLDYKKELKYITTKYTANDSVGTKL